MSRLTQVPTCLYFGFRLRAFHPLRGCFPTPSPNLTADRFDGPTTPAAALLQRRFGLVRVRSPLLAQSRLLSFPPGTEMFQFPGLASALRPMHGSAPCGFPHSDIRASMGICPWARLFAACHVLLRLREPRHPSCALVSFLFSFRL